MANNLRHLLVKGPNTQISFKTGALVDTLDTLNPLYYSGYVYDDEIDFYYLRSRYYNANRGRFINADNLLEVNLFRYCDNNPIMLLDSEGDFPFWAVSYPGELHRAVQKEIVKDYRGTMVMEVYIVRQDGSIGRIDLLNKSNNQIWEVKTTVPSVDMIIEQLSSYLLPAVVKSKDKNDYNEQFTYGKGLKGKTFSYTSTKGYQFNISYKEKQAGIIQYSYDALPSKQKQPARQSAKELVPKSPGVMALIGGGLLLCAMGVNSRALEKIR